MPLYICLVPKPPNLSQLYISFLSYHILWSDEKNFRTYMCSRSNFSHYDNSWNDCFSSLSATNVIHAVSASLGIIYIALWTKYKSQEDLLLGSLLLGLNIWTRTDGIVFVLGALPVIGFISIKINNGKHSFHHYVLLFLHYFGCFL